MSGYGVSPPGFRLPDRAAVGAVRLQVGSLDRSIDYYEHVVGLRVLSRERESAVLAAHDDRRPLVRLEERAGARPARGALGLYHFALLLPDRAGPLRAGDTVVALCEPGREHALHDLLTSPAS